MPEGLHHFHKRKRIYQKYESYPHPNKLKRFVDKAVYFIVSFGIIMTLPQIIKIWVEKNASGVSSISWAAYTISSIFWLAYGIIHKEKPIIFSYSIWVLLNAFVCIGALIYG